MRVFSQDAQYELFWDTLNLICIHKMTEIQFYISRNVIRDKSSVRATNLMKI